MTSASIVRFSWTASFTLRKAIAKSGSGRRAVHRPARQARHGLLRSGLPELLLLHGIAVRGLRPLVLAGLQQEHAQPHRDLSPGEPRRAWCSDPYADDSMTHQMNIPPYSRNWTRTMSRGRSTTHSPRAAALTRTETAARADTPMTIRSRPSLTSPTRPSTSTRIRT